MGIYLRLLAFFMLLLLPLLRLTDRLTAADPGFTYADPAPQSKPARETLPYVFGPNDIAAAPDGDPSADGSEPAPVTLARAKTLAAEKRASGVTGPITVWLRGGDYLLTAPLAFDAQDATDVTYAAVPGEAVRLSGAQTVTGWEADTVNGHDCLSAPVPQASAFTTVLRGDTQLPCTRYPERGFFYVKTTDHSDGMFTDETSPWKGWSYGDLAITPDKAQTVRDFYAPRGVTLRLLHYWCDELSYVDSYDAAADRLRLTVPLSMRAEAGQKYYFENVREAFDTPGEWYYDSLRGRLCYLPLPGETAQTLALRLAVTDRLLTAENCRGLSFDGLTFCDTCSPFPDLTGQEHWLAAYGMRHPQAEFDCGGAVELSHSSGITFRNCDFRNLGTCAVKFKRAVKDAAVIGCDLTQIGACGIFIDGASGGSDAALTERITVRDTVIRSYGRYFSAGCGILLTHARDCDLDHNDISDGYYTAISAGWMWGYAPSVTQNIRITNNRIRQIGQGWLSDMGGVYTLGRQPGTVIAGNVISEVAADPDEGGYGGWGVYLDEGSSGIEVRNNLVYACGSQTFHQHYGEGNRICNNIFALGAEGALRSSFSGAEHQSGFDDPDSHVEFSLTGNIFLTDNMPMYAELRNGCFTDGGNLYWDLRNHAHIFCNWWSDPNPLTRLYTGAVQRTGHFQDATIADPGFRDPAAGDFALPENNPALDEIGFEVWDTNDAGTLTAR
ncbi:MAG: right-handed parallel beta-helix repeat-containing protein [Clostridia bacterium]|nr:right-handed parallel beta-helix repeat-containing protein [Clostridia bacterium]